MDDLREHNYKPYSYMKEYLPKMKSAPYMAPKQKLLGAVYSVAKNRRPFVPRRSQPIEV